MSFDISRERIKQIIETNVEWADAEDANDLIDLLLESYDLDGVYTWLFFHNANLGATPLFLLEMGRSREVFREARRLVVVAT